MRSSHFFRVAGFLCAVCFSWHRAAPVAAQQGATPQPTSVQQLLAAQQAAIAPRFQAERAPPPLNFEDAIDTPVDPATYRLSPGDELMVSVIARTPADYPAPVSPDGAIFLPSVGQLSVR